jgi:uncharacterized MAPEG superfamily protein
LDIALWMLPAAALLPYVTVGIAKAGRSGYDNALPRQWTEGLRGWRQRAEWAHRNHMEAFPPFAAAVLAAQLRGAGDGWTGLLACGFVALRIGYTAAYIADRPGLRSILWFGGVGCVAVLFCRAA